MHGPVGLKGYLAWGNHPPPKPNSILNQAGPAQDPRAHLLLVNAVSLAKWRNQNVARKPELTEKSCNVFCLLLFRRWVEVER